MAFSQLGQSELQQLKAFKKSSSNFVQPREFNTEYEAAGRDTTALAEAVAAGKPELVRLLLAAGADPSTVLPGGETALFRAVGCPDIASMLLGALTAKRHTQLRSG